MFWPFTHPWTVLRTFQVGGTPQGLALNRKGTRLYVGNEAGYLNDIDGLHSRLRELPSPYGDGSASELTVKAIRELIELG